MASAEVFGVVAAPLPAAAAPAVYAVSAGPKSSMINEPASLTPLTALMAGWPAAFSEMDMPGVTGAEKVGEPELWPER